MRMAYRNDFTAVLDIFMMLLTWFFKSFDNTVTFVMHVFNFNVVVGFHSNLDPKKCYGVAFYNTPNGTQSRPFTVDRPENLDEPPPVTIKSIFSQIKQMGYDVVQIEVRTDRELRVYRDGVERPLLVQER